MNQIADFAGFHRRRIRSRERKPKLYLLGKVNLSLMRVRGKIRTVK